MGDLNVGIAKSRAQSQKFIRHLLNDVEALTYMLDNNWFEDDIIRIGAEQELCIVDESFKPAPKNIELLERINNPDVVTELAKFNLELNLDPYELKADCFRRLEQDILNKLELVNTHAHDMGLESVITGILPTIRKSDVLQENTTPLERYRLIIDVLNKLRGSKVDLKIGGTDELMVQHDSALMEACNTSFQVHLQTKPEEFVDQYNLAQVMAAPTMALAVNSPLLFGKRLWHETRIALFQQALDTRKKVEHLRERSPRVIFGNQWLEHSIAELYKEDIARYPVLLNATIEQDSMDIIHQGHVPTLRALNIHNGTIYRWNRPCYGISANGKPHIRIENRILPAGPSVLDEIANAAFWIGLMRGNEDNMKDLVAHFDFSDARNNFFAACRYGINSYFYWTDGRRIDAIDLIQNDLIPMARHGLQKSGIESKDIDRYIGVIEERVDKKTTGASWILSSFNNMIKISDREEASTAVTAKMIEMQKTNRPVHTWQQANLYDIVNWSPLSLKVEEFMTTDLFTARPQDILEFVADVMEWRKIRHLPIENKYGKLEGIISSRLLLRHYRERQNADKQDKKNYTAKDIMIKDPITISPYETIMDAISIMQENQIGCLPVVKNDKLVGIVTEVDFLRLSTRLLKRLGDQQEQLSLHMDEEE